MNLRPPLSAILACCLAAYLLPGCSVLEHVEQVQVINETAPTGLQVEDRAPAAELKMAGLGSDNTITGTDLRFRVDGVKQLDAETSIGMVINDKTKTFVPLAASWSLDPRTGALVIKAEDVKAIMKKLPDGQFTIILGLAGPNGEVAMNASFKAYKWTPQDASSTQA